MLRDFGRWLDNPLAGLLRPAASLPCQPRSDSLPGTRAWCYDGCMAQAVENRDAPPRNARSARVVPGQAGRAPSTEAAAEE